MILWSARALIQGERLRKRKQKNGFFQIKTKVNGSDSNRGIRLTNKFEDRQSRNLKCEARITNITWYLDLVCIFHWAKCACGRWNFHRPHMASMVTDDSFTSVLVERNLVQRFFKKTDCLELYRFQSYYVATCNIGFWAIGWIDYPWRLRKKKTKELHE